MALLRKCLGRAFCFRLEESSFIFISLTHTHTNQGTCRTDSWLLGRGKVPVARKSGVGVGRRAGRASEGLASEGWESEG